MIALTPMVQQANHPLPAGFKLDEYSIEQQLSLGGFSIVYLATDSHGKRVAIKEYLPNTLALRGEGRTSPIIAEDHLPAFRYGMKCFFEEGRALAGLSHPNVVRVLNFFRANETVYMVMEYEHGRTLQEIIQKNRASVTENFLRNVFTKMLAMCLPRCSMACARCTRVASCIWTSNRQTSTCATTMCRCSSTLVQRARR